MRESDAYDMVEEGWRELRGMGMDLEDENKFINYLKGSPG